MLKASTINDIRASGDAMLAIRRCRHGTMMYMRQDIYVGRSFAEYGEYSEGEVDVFRQCVRPGDVALNELGNVRALPVALGRAAGRTKVPALDYRGANNFGGIALGAAEGEDVAVVVLDEVELPKVRLIKVDVEGMELDVLAGARQTLARHRPILYVENDRADKAEALVARLLEDGYRMWWHTPPLYNPANFLGNPQNVFGNIVSFNMLCLPRETAAPPQGLREIATPQEASGFLRGLPKATR